jgi:hypothetical protein
LAWQNGIDLKNHAAMTEWLMKRWDEDYPEEYPEHYKKKIERIARVAALDWDLQVPIGSSDRGGIIPVCAPPFVEIEKAAGTWDRAALR